MLVPAAAMAAGVLAVDALLATEALGPEGAARDGCGASEVPPPFRAAHQPSWNASATVGGPEGPPYKGSARLPRADDVDGAGGRLLVGVADDGPAVHHFRDLEPPVVTGRVVVSLTSVIRLICLT